MTSVIKTYENVISDFDVADYPACKLFFPVDETSGQSLTDSVGGVVVTFDNTVTPDGTKLTVGGVSSNGPVSNGVAFPDVGLTDDFVILFAGSPGAASSVGGAGAGVSVVTFSTAAAVLNLIADTDGNSDANATALCDASTEMAGFYSDRGDALGNGAVFTFMETDGTTMATEHVTITNADAEIDFNGTSARLNLTASTVIYGVAIFQFSEIPSDVLTAVRWMNYQWRLGNKVVYPGWKGKT